MRLCSAFKISIIKGVHFRAISKGQLRAHKGEQALVITLEHNFQGTKTIVKSIKDNWLLNTYIKLNVSFFLYHTLHYMVFMIEIHNKVKAEQRAFNFDFLAPNLSNFLSLNTHHTTILHQKVFQKYTKPPIFDLIVNASIKYPIESGMYCQRASKGFDQIQRSPI